MTMTPALALAVMMLMAATALAATTTMMMITGKALLVRTAEVKMTIM